MSGGRGPPRMAPTGSAHSPETTDDVPAPSNPLHSWIWWAGKGPAPPHPCLQCRAALGIFKWVPAPLHLPACPLQEHSEFYCQPPSSSAKPEWGLD